MQIAQKVLPQRNANQFLGYLLSTYGLLSLLFCDKAREKPVEVAF